MGYQHIVIQGNVGKDPEITYTPQGIAVCKFSVAVSKVTGKGENRKEKTTWFRVTTWRERAETASQYIKKGMKILVAGTIDLSTYTNKQGQAAGTLELTADEFQFLDSRSDDDDAAPHRSNGNNRRPAQAASEDEGESNYIEEAADIPF